jgi:hypothetical protein
MWAALKWQLDRGHVLVLVGYALALPGISLVYYQLKSGVLMARRAKTVDLVLGPLKEHLLPAQLKLKAMLGREHLAFSPKETIDEALDGMPTEEQLKLRALVLEILNFYERVAIGISTHTLDDEILYDDQGLLAIRFHSWATPFIDELQKTVNTRVFADFVMIAYRWQQRYENQMQALAKANGRSIVKKGLKIRGPFA